MSEENTLEKRVGVLEDKVESIQKVQETLNEVVRPSNNLVSKYEGQDIKAFITSGNIVVGKAHFDGNWVDISDESKSRTALCNMSHVVSITRLKD